MTNAEYKETYSKPWILILTNRGYVRHVKYDGSVLYSSLAKAKAARLKLQESDKYRHCFIEIWAWNEKTQAEERLV